ncbi:hypothetical protein Q5752_003822 [Cryptotrichosporon argae]
MRTLDTHELDTLHQLAARGGIARARALDDCVAAGPDQLMYIQGDEVIVLRDHGPDLIAYCEGEVGWVKRAAIAFETPVSGPSSPRPAGPASPLPRSPASSCSQSPQSPPALFLTPHDSAKTSFETPALDTPRSDMPTTLLTAPSPPSEGASSSVFRRASHPFELESPSSPGAATLSGAWRASGLSSDSAEGFGVGGGFMLGAASKRTADPEDIEQIKDDHSPISPAITTPHTNPGATLSSSTSSNSLDPTRLNAAAADGRASPLSVRSLSAQSEASAVSSAGSWDIYSDYARDSMYGLAKRMSMAVLANRFSRAPRASRVPQEWQGTAGEDGGDRDAAWAASNGGGTSNAATEAEDSVDKHRRQRTKPPALTLVRTASASSDPATPTALRSPARGSATSPQTPVSPADSLAAGPSKHTAAELRRRLARNIVRSPSPRAPDSPPPASPQHEEVAVSFTPLSPLSPSASASHSTETDETVRLHPVVLRIPSPSEPRPPAPLRAGSMPTLMASPIPPDEEFGRSLAPPRPGQSPQPSQLSPNLSQGAWTPHSPSSPHSIAATQQAHTALATSEGQATATLVGHVETDLLASKGPVPIMFLIGGPGTPGVLPSERKTSGPMGGLGLGLPSSMVSPEPRFASAPVSSNLGTTPVHEMEQPSRFPPTPIRTLTAPTLNSAGVGSSPSSIASPWSAATSTSASFTPSASAPASRPRSRSFSAAFTRAIGRGKKETPTLVVDTSAPPLPKTASPRIMSASLNGKRGMAPRKQSKGTSPGYSSDREPPSLFRASASTSTVNLPSSASTTEALFPLPMAMSTSSSLAGSVNKQATRKSSARTLPAPVSHRDFADTVHADGMDFELVQPRRAEPVVHASPGSPAAAETTSKRKPRPETDEWGFIQDVSPTPEIFQSRLAPGEVRAAEQKWLSIISTPLSPGSAPPKKVKKLVLDAGVPASLRGRVWAWFMSAQMSARVPGLYQELLGHDKGNAQAQIDRDVSTVYTDHSIFAEPNSPGQQDLRSLLRAYSNFAPAGYRPEMAPLAGALLIHCVVEDAFWLLAGLVNGALKTYYAKDRQAARADMRTFEVLLAQTVPDVAKLFQELGIETRSFLEGWWMTLFIRCLPWPTVMRIFDAVISEGPRFLLVASLTLLAVSRERLLDLPRAAPAVIAYLRSPPQDGLVLPENFMRACEGKAKPEDVKKARAAVDREMGAAA